ncbi:LysR family transcriptional regulator [Undibacterium curvum]|jgi:DNA-binding transcriptional LysR family regulator|uniref:LysR family transcriptional regulator n=1 Tax=Undibacterium curvum TaxID=2762294 RepID=A0ABR7A1L5_9BURK|nr:LysR family transcriptional regulator [Undibacterium curvum]MBC3930567.1 LysR family transcriptional regulator [Undibacterium curvum]
MLNIESLIAFVSVMDTGSFSAAADRLGQTPSGISRAISRMETQLGTTLLKRTTRRLDITEEGEWLLARARQILSDLHDTEASMNARLSQPSGLVRVSAATPVLNHLIAPLAADFMDSYPLIRLDLVSGETVVDLIEEKIDLAIRIGPLADSTLHARGLGSSRLRLLASPDYLKRYGIPQKIEDLSAHRLIGFTSPATLNMWPLTQDNGNNYLIQAQITASSGETLRHLALRGTGIVCLADFLTSEDREKGQLLSIMEDVSLPWHQPVWAVFYKQGALAPRINALVTFLAERLKTTLD